MKVQHHADDAPGASSEIGPIDAASKSRRALRWPGVRGLPIASPVAPSWCGRCTMIKPGRDSLLHRCSPGDDSIVVDHEQQLGEGPASGPLRVHREDYERNVSLALREPHPHAPLTNTAAA